MPTSRRTLLTGAAAASAAGLAAIGLETFFLCPRRVVTSRHIFSSDRSVFTPSDSVSAPADPLAKTIRIVHLSDLHLHACGTFQKLIVDHVAQAAADLLVFTGDSIDSSRGEDFLKRFLSMIPPHAHAMAVLGNWEYGSGVPIDRIRAIYHNAGVELLVNRSIDLVIKGIRIRITGLDDLIGGQPDPTLAMESASFSIPHHLLLAHCPAVRDLIAFPTTHPISFQLSGHTHGGQVAPFGRPIVTPWGSGRYVAGWYCDHSQPLYVSRGLGTSTIPVRLGSTPEVVVIDWLLS
jgi:uncharacterized protein